MNGNGLRPTEYTEHPEFQIMILSPMLSSVCSVYSVGNY